MALMPLSSRSNKDYTLDLNALGTQQPPHSFRNRKNRFFPKSCAPYSLRLFHSELVSYSSEHLFS